MNLKWNTKYTTVNSKKNLIGIIVLLHIIASGSVTGFLFRNIYIDIAIVILEFMYVISVGGYKLKISYEKILILLLFFTAIIMTQIYTHYGSIFYVFRFVIMMITGVWFVHEVISRENFANIVEKSIRIITIIALVSYVVFQLIKIPGGKMLMNDIFYNYKNYFYLHYVLPIPSAYFFNWQIVRNCGIFWEPGILQIYSNVGLLLYFIQGKKDIRVSLLYILCTLSTFSTTGFITLGLIILYFKFIFKKKCAKKIVGGILSLIVVTIILGALLIEKKENAYASFIYRTTDIEYGLKILSSHLLCGTGLNNNTEFNSYYQDARGNSNGLIAWMYQMGLMGIIFLGVVMIRFLKRAKRTQKTDIALICILIFFIENSTEPLFTFAFNYLIMSWIMSANFNKKIVEINRWKYST